VHVGWSWRVALRRVLWVLGAAGVNLQYRHHQAFEEPSAARLDAFFLFLLIYPAEKEED
jgi:hypothetical protein